MPCAFDCRPVYLDCRSMSNDCPMYTLRLLQAYMVESNENNFLSAGQIPLPTLFFTLCVFYFLLACYWLYVLRKAT